MSEAATDVKLVPGKLSRGFYPVSLIVAGDVVFAAKVNPHESKSITEYLKQACRTLPKLKEQRDELRQALMNLARPRDGKANPNKHPFREQAGGLVQVRFGADGEIVEQLTNFTATIVADVVRDDGVERDTAIELDIMLAQQVKRVIVPTSQFGAMNWPIEHMGAAAILMPGQGVKDAARAAIQLLSPTPIACKTIYTHTGWREVPSGNGGKGGFVYLHGGGCIGNSDAVSIELSPGMAGYILPEPPVGDELRDAVRSSLALLKLAPKHLILPVFCGPWRAVLGQCDFAIHLAGPSGAFKSELAALLLQHFGAGLDARHLTAAWSSTKNSLEMVLFTAKETISVLDDFAPNGTPQDQAKWHTKADRIIRAQGNNSGRGRLRADSSMRAAKSPRGLVLSTGEEIPRGQSLRARMHIGEISPGDIDPIELTRCQQDARDGKYAAAMAGFIAWLAPHYGRMKERLRSEADELRNDATSGDRPLPHPGHHRTAGGGAPSVHRVRPARRGNRHGRGGRAVGRRVGCTDPGR